MRRQHEKSLRYEIRRQFPWNRSVNLCRFCYRRFLLLVPLLSSFMLATSQNEWLLEEVKSVSLPQMLYSRVHSTDLSTSGTGNEWSQHKSLRCVRSVAFHVLGILISYNRMLRELFSGRTVSFGFFPSICCNVVDDPVSPRQAPPPVYGLGRLSHQESGVLSGASERVGTRRTERCFTSG